MSDPKRGRPRRRQMIGFGTHKPLKLSGPLFEDGEDGMSLFEKMLERAARLIGDE